jgi:hypothetical protein
MTTRLSEALHEAAEEIEGYDVLSGAVARGRRRRRWSGVASALAVLAVLALVAAMATPWPSGRAPVADSGPPTIPEDIGPAAPFTRSPSGSPPGPASIIFTASEGGDVVTVGAQDDTYRVIGTDAMAGRNALLSRKGDRVAYTRGAELSIVDLIHGGTRTFGPGDAAVDDFAPAAWLPDGSGLVVLATAYADDPTTQGTSKRLSILDVDTGTLDQFAEATWPIATPGFAVAVSPDGNRIAYQFSDFITVYERDTGTKTRLDLPSYRLVLAGRSAWAPDGSLTLLEQLILPGSNGRQWRLLLVDPATGVQRGALRGMADQVTIRLIGWSDGNPVVVGYDGPYSAMSGVPGDVIWGGFGGTVGVYQLTQQGPRTLVAPVEGISHIDVAETLLTDPHTRPGDPPWTFPLWWLGVAAAVVVVVAAMAVAGFGGAVQLPSRAAGGVSRRAAGRGRSSGPGAA